MVHQFIKDGRPRKGLSYPEYRDIMKERAESNNSNQKFGSNNVSADPERLNFRRTLRIEKNYVIDPKLEGLVKQIDSYQLWMVLTEPWCGDSAQNLPYIAMISEINPKIELKILLRDQNNDIIDLYLTNGISRSIPKLIAFDGDGNEIFQWGPRPAEAEALVKKLKSEGKKKEEYLEALHLWYAGNRGKNLESEFSEIIGGLYT
jgi:Thioredoxin